MKKKTILCTLGGIALFGAGWFTCLKVNNSTELDSLKTELLRVQRETIIQAETVMNNNNLWDYDGSDDMYKYMLLYHNCDSLTMQIVNFNSFKH